VNPEGIEPALSRWVPSCELLCFRSEATCTRLIRAQAPFLTVLAQASPWFTHTAGCDNMLAVMLWRRQLDSNTGTSPNARTRTPYRV